MTLEALLTFVGILAAVLAIARPVQRRSLMLFASMWRIGLAILLSFILLVCRDAPLGMRPPVGWPLPLVLFGLTVCAFLIPVLAALWSWISWYRAKLTGGRSQRIEKLFQAALREHEFDEVERIVRKNLHNLYQLPASAISVLFHPSMVTTLVDSHSFVHLELLADSRFLKSLENRFGAVDTVVRAFLHSEASPIRAAVAKRYGGIEHPRYTDLEQEIMEKTFENPTWYVHANAHYPLVISAVEALQNGQFDTAYNDIGRNYAAQQGISTRLQCPIYLAAKTEVIAIEAALENKVEDDLYISDLSDIFRTILERSKYIKSVWDSDLSNPEFPTPYAYLLYEINTDLRNLSAKAVETSISSSEPPRAAPPGRIARDLAQQWSYCIWKMSGSEGQVSPSFRKNIIEDYLLFILALGWGPSEVSAGIRNNTEGLDAWRDLFLSAMNKWFRCDSSREEVLKETMELLDQGKRYVSDGLDWLEEKLVGSSPIS